MKGGENVYGGEDIINTHFWIMSKSEKSKNSSRNILFPGINENTRRIGLKN